MRHHVPIEGLALLCLLACYRSVLGSSHEDTSDEDGADTDMTGGDASGSDSDVDDDASADADGDPASDDVGCSNLRPDLDASRRVSPSVTLLGGSSLATTVTRLAFLGDRLLVGTTEGLSVGEVDVWDFSAVPGQEGVVAALATTEDRIFVGRDPTPATPELQPLSVLDGDLNSVATNSPGEGIIIFRADPQPPNAVLAGARGGTMYRTTNAGALWTVTGATAGAHITSIVYDTSTDQVLAGTGESTMRLVSNDRGATFSQETVDFGFNTVAASRWATGEGTWLLLGSTAGPSVTGLYGCSAPCTGPSLLAGSSDSAGRVPDIPEGGAWGAALVYTGAHIAFATDQELWVSKSNSFVLVDSLFECDAPGTLYDLAALGDDLYVGTSVGLLRLSLSSI